MKNKKLKMGLVAIAAVAGFCINGHAQSVDSLLDKLVDKGVLSVKEANDLREESDKDFTKAYSAKSGMSDWVSALKLNGDLRIRSDSFHYENAAATDRQRFRYRVRFGIVAVMTDGFEAGMRLMTSEPAVGGAAGGNPLSGNASFSDNAAKKFIYVDQAYAKWTPIRSSDLTVALTLGKMENPFVFSELVFDNDYTHEGAALQLTYNLSDKHTLRSAGGAFMLDEVAGSSHDPYMYGAQLRLESVWNKHWSSSVGVAALGIVNEDRLNAARSSTFDITGTATNVVSTTTWTVPNQNGGNLRSPVGGASGSVGTLQNNYTPIVADASVTFTLDEFWHYNVPFPIRLGADFIHNPAASTENNGYSVGVLFGKAGKKGLWELGYTYKHIEGDAWYEEVLDSNFGAFYQAGSTRSGNSSGYFSGTNMKGHVVRGSYTPYNALTLGVIATFAELIQESPVGSDSKTTRVFLDASLKF